MSIEARLDRISEQAACGLNGSMFIKSASASGISDAPGRCLLGTFGQRSNAGSASYTKSQAAIVISEWERRTAEDVVHQWH